MHGYVDPFAHRFARSRPTDDDTDTRPDDEAADVEDDPDERETSDGPQIGLDARAR
jgi:hypothetical protein